MFQYRGKGSGHRMFAYERDLLNLYRWICQGAAERLHPNRLPPAVKVIAEHTGMTNADLCDALAAMRNFINNANHDSPLYDDFDSAWTSSGFDKVKPAALIAMFFQMGVGCTHYYFNFIREAIAAGKTVPDAQELGGVVDRMIHAMGKTDPSATRRLMNDALKSHDATRGDYPDPLKNNE